MHILNVLLQILIIPLLIRFQTSNCSKRFAQDNKLYYIAPEFDINFANVTFGISRYIDENDPKTSIFSLGQAIGIICQADLINRKKTQFTFNGVINLLFQDFGSIRSSGQGAIITMLSNNFHSNSAELNWYYKRNSTVNITGMLGTIDYGTSKINSAASNYFGIPFVTSGDLARSDPDNFFNGFFPAEKTTFMQTYNTIDYNSFNAVLDILAYFNWTLVGNVFVSNSFGYGRQRDVATYSASNTIPMFACQTIFYFDVASVISYNDGSNIDQFCNCVLEKSVMQVSVLWMDTSTATSFINILRSRCKQSEDWTFIITDDLQSPADIFLNSTSLLKNSLLLRPNGPWDVASFLQECQDGASPAAKETITELLEAFANTAYQCSSTDDSLELCESLLSGKARKCYCPTSLFQNDPYYSHYFYSVDSMSTFAEGIRLLTNNCTFLNEKVDEEVKNELNINNFCNLTSFQPAVLATALRYVNFTGYTGEIFFSSDALIRSIKNFYLYSAYTNNYDAELAGILNATTVQINVSAIQFVNGKTPISTVVPQNPNLSYAVVDVFFALAIAFLIICFVSLAILIIYRKNLSMRKTSPIVSLLMLLGVTFIAIAQLLQSLSRTDALCILVLYFFHTGFIILIAGALAKNYRLYRIFANRSALALNITEGSLLIIMAVVSGVYIVGLTIFVAALEYKAEVLKSSSNIYYQFVECVIPNDTWNTIFDFYTRLYTLFFLIVTLILAWLTRKVRSDYRESKELTAFICITVATFIILVPLELTFGDETDSEIFRYIINMELYVIIIISALTLLFFPKIYEIHCENKRKIKSSQMQIN